MIFSKPCQYAILAMTYLVGQERGSLRSIREISEQIEVPLPFLSKVISTLSRKGLVTSRRGPKGGITLGRPASRLTVGDIVEAIDGPLESGRCILGFAECCGKAPCPLHDTWNEARGKLEQALHRKTLLDLTRKRNDANTEKRRFEAHPRR